MTKKMTKEETIENIEFQIAELQNKVAMELETRDHYLKQVAVWRELMDLKLEGVKQGMLTPEYPHHKNPRFWELQAMEMRFKYDEEVMTQEGHAESYLYKAESYQATIDTLQTELDKLENKKND